MKSVNPSSKHSEKGFFIPCKTEKQKSPGVDAAQTKNGKTQSSEERTSHCGKEATTRGSQNKGYSRRRRYKEDALEKERAPEA